MTNPLNDKQKRFCDEYLIDRNATQAAIRAGYSKKTASVQSFDLLRKPNIQHYLAGKSEKALSKLDISLDRTLQEIGRIAFQDARNYFDQDGSLIPIHQLSDDAAAALSGFEIEELFEFIGKEKVQIGVTKKIKRFDKTKALEMLMKYYGAFERDNKQKETKVVVPLTDDQVGRIIDKMNGDKPTSSKQV